MTDFKFNLLQPTTITIRRASTGTFVNDAGPSDDVRVRVAHRSSASAKVFAEMDWDSSSSSETYKTALSDAPAGEYSVTVTVSDPTGTSTLAGALVIEVATHPFSLDAGPVAVDAKQAEDIKFTSVPVGGLTITVTRDNEPTGDLFGSSSFDVRQEGHIETIRVAAPLGAYKLFSAGAPGAPGDSEAPRQILKGTITVGTGW